jgi:molecular chaperone DnaK
VAGDDLEAIKSKTEELTKVVQEVGAAIYQQAQQAQAEQQQGPPGSDAQGSGDEDAVDAEYEKK